MIDRFKQLIRKNNIRTFFKNYAGTCICILLFTMYAMIFNFEESTYIPTALFFTGVGFFFAETILTGNKKKIGYGAFIVMGICFAILLELSPTTKIEMLYAGSIIMIFCVSLYHIVREKNDLAEYITRSATNLFKVGLTTSIVIISASVLYLLIDYLLFPISDEAFLKVIYFIMGFYSAPFTLMCLVDTKEPTMGFVDNVISKVLIPIMNIVFGVMIVYIIRIIVQGEMPKNEIFAYVTMLFVMMAPLSIVAKKFEGKYYEFNNKYLGYLFIAPLVLQTYSLVLRINQYGLTITRYVGLFVIAFEALTIFLMHYRYQKFVNKTILALAGFAVVLLVVPYLNAYDAVTNYHIHKIKSTLTGREISDLSLTERKSVYMSYDYLNDFEENPLKKVESLVNKENINIICNDECRKDEARYEDHYVSFIYTNKEDSIDISNYKTLQFVDKNIYDDVKSINSLTIEKQKVDFSLYDNYVKENKDKYDVEDDFIKFTEENKIVKVNDEIDLLIKYLNIRYNDETDMIEYLDLEGYFLYK